MESFHKAKAVTVKSTHLNKYLVADDDQQTIRLSRDGSSRKARWLVEENGHLVRLKSFHGKYLTASGESFLLGTTGKKVSQTLPESMNDTAGIEWEPIKFGLKVKLKAFGGNSFLRANGGTPPWRNSVTHDSPDHNASTHNLIFWRVEAVDIPENESLTAYLAMVSSFSSVSGELSGLELESPVSIHSSLSFSPYRMVKSGPVTKRPAMKLFHMAKSVRLRSHHDKYLTADEDEESVIQHRNGASKNTKWTVEFVDKTSNIIRLKSCYNKYLTPSNQPFLLGMTGRKIIQTVPGRLDSSVEWEPIREGSQVKLRTRYGKFLRANGSVPPWRNSVTHDIPHRSSTQDWILWNVDVVDVLVNSPVSKPPSSLVTHSDSFASESTTSPSSADSLKSPSFSGQESSDSLDFWPPKVEDGRVIYYHIADEFGEINEGAEGFRMPLKRNSVEELKKRLEHVTGLEDIIVCTRSPLNGMLYPLRLQLPPNNAAMNVIVLPSSSKVSRDFAETRKQM